MKKKSYQTDTLYPAVVIVSEAQSAQLTPLAEVYRPALLNI
jgi:hypothetical protein